MHNEDYLKFGQAKAASSTTSVTPARGEKRAITLASPMAATRASLPIRKRQATRRTSTNVDSPAGEEKRAMARSSPIYTTRASLPSIPQARSLSSTNQMAPADEERPATDIPSTTGAAPASSLSPGPNPNNNPLIAEVIALWRQRQTWVRARVALELRAQAACRSYTNGDKTEAKALFQVILGQARADMKARMRANGKPAAKPLKQKEAKRDVPKVLANILEPILPAILLFDGPLRDTEARLTQYYAPLLPGYEWMKSVRGFGEINFISLVGEAGDIGSYRSPSCLWKRMGVGVIEGQRQRRVTDVALAEAMGFNPMRAAVACMLGQSLLKLNKSEYRAEYDRFKAKEQAREDDGKPKSLKHAHNRAVRKISKDALRDLWRVWRQATKKTSTIELTPAASLSPKGERAAIAFPSTTVEAPRATIPLNGHGV